MSTSTPELPRDTRKLTRSPIVNVIWQLRFTSESSFKDGRAALAFREALGRPTTMAQQADPGMAFQLSVGGAGVPIPPPSAEAAWRFDMPDGVAIVLSSSSVSIETSRYSAWEEGFRGLIADVTRALETTLKPGLQVRLGLRYVNVLFGKVFEHSEFRSLDDFGDYVDRALLGFAPGVLQATVDMIQGRQTLALDGIKVNLNYALVQAEGSDLGFLVDVDSYVEQPENFAQKSVVEESERTHNVALSIFQKCITSQAWEQMGPTGDR